MQHILLEVLIYLAAAVLAVPISQRLGFGSVLGYLAAGIIIGPGLGVIGAEAADLRHFAEFGVVLMLFLIGLELKPKALWDMRKKLLGLGGLQVGASVAVISIFCSLLGVEPAQAYAIGMILSLSSTAIVMQTLNEKRLNRTEGGTSSFAVLLFQDIAAVPFLAILPLLAVSAAGQSGAETESMALLEDVPGWMRAVFIIGAVGLVMLAGRYLPRPVFWFLNMSGLHEVMVAATLMFVVGIAVIMSAVGLSPALGTFLAGVALANSEYRHQIESDIAPFKGLLLGLFFIAVGAGMDLDLLAERPVWTLALVLCLMGLKYMVLLALSHVFHIEGRDRVLFTLSLAQAGEFGFFLTTYALSSRVLSVYQANVIQLVIVLSMCLTPLLFLIHDRLIARLRASQSRGDENVDEQGVVIIAGMGRFGQVVNRMLLGQGHKTVVLDSRAETVSRMRRFGIKGYYGEIDRPALLEAAGLKDARAIVLGIDNPDIVMKVARYVRRNHPHVQVIARAHDRQNVYELYAAGVTLSVREVFDSSVRAGKYALQALGYSEDDIERHANAYFEHDRDMLSELAKVWDPNTPVEQNEAYIAKARAQQQSFEDMLRRQMEERAEAAERARQDEAERARNSELAAAKAQAKAEAKAIARAISEANTMAQTDTSTDGGAASAANRRSPDE